MDRTYLLSEIARALDVCVDVLRTWLARGVVRLTANHEDYKWRRYSKSDAAQLAAIHALTSHLEISKAAGLMQEILEHQRAGWDNFLRESPSSIMIFVSESGRALVYPPKSPATIADLLNPNVGEYTACFVVGPSIASALTKLEAL